MTSTIRGDAEVLRGLRIEGAPLRLGRARATVAPPPAGAPARVTEHEAEAAQALREAHARALREGREEGLRAGRAEGLREGRAQAAEQIREAVQRAVREAEQALQAERERLQRIAQTAEECMAGLVARAHDEIVALCYETLCRIAGARAVEPQWVRSQLARLLEQHGTPEVLLHVHPQDAELLQREQADAAGGIAARWVADPEVALGGCILQSPGGALDARMETMLAACKAALLEARAQAAAPTSPGEGA